MRKVKKVCMYVRKRVRIGSQPSSDRDSKIYRLAALILKYTL